MFLSCAGAERLLRKTKCREAKALMCRGHLRDQEGAIPRCCKFIKRSRAAALISHHSFFREALGELIAPGQLKSLGTDAFIAFGSELSREVREGSE